MQPLRILATVSTTLALAACATAPTRPAAPVASGPTPASSGGETVDLALVRTAASGLGVRAQFRSCIDAAAADAAATQACIDGELAHQDARIEQALAARRVRSTSNGDVDAAQAQWRTERDRICGPGSPGLPAAQRVQAGICRLEATAARADVLAR